MIERIHIISEDVDQPSQWNHERRFVRREMTDRVHVISEDVHPTIAMELRKRFKSHHTWLSNTREQLSGMYDRLGEPEALCHSYESDMSRCEACECASATHERSTHATSAFMRIEWMLNVCCFIQMQTKLEHRNANQMYSYM